VWMRRGGIRPFSKGVGETALNIAVFGKWGAVAFRGGKTAGREHRKKKDRMKK